jgi:hypothetical protein
MHLTFLAPLDEPHHLQAPAVPGQTLGTWFRPDVYEHITAVMVNGAFRDDWPAYEPQQSDRLRVYLKTGALFTTLAAGATIWGIIASAALTAVVSSAVSLGLGYVLRALMPTPHQTEGKTEAAYGISGRTNTTAQGTPKSLCYGTQRVYGHILTTRCAVAPSTRALTFGILYSMGEGPISGMKDAQIDDIDVNQYAGIETYVRLGGADNATLIHPDFATLSQVWTDGRQLPLAQDVIYQTRGTRTNAVTLFLTIPVLRTAGGGAATQHLSVDFRRITDATWSVADATLTWSGTTQSPQFFATRRYDLPDSTQWLFRLRLLDTTNQEGVLPTLYNVMEEQGGDPLYLGQPLLAFRGISSAQIQSFDSMRGSAFLYGRLVPIWNGTTFTTAWSNNRAWVLYDLLTNVRVGLGHRVDPATLDLPSFLAAAAYWATQAGSHVGFPKDRCDLLINDRRPAPDWINILLSEGRAALVPSQSGLKLVIDQAGEPGLLYSSPGNMVEGSARPSQGAGDGLPPNTIFVQFPDEAMGFRPHLLTYRAPGTESEPQREAPAVTLYSLTSFAHAYWMARYLLERLRLVQRHVAWTAPLGALVSEPLDHVAVSYPTTNFARGVSGFLGDDSTTERLVLGTIATLVPSTSYSVLVRHMATNLMETRAVVTPSGPWGAVLLDVPLSVPPVTGDLWALGVTNTSLHHLVIEQVTQDQDGYRLAGSVYVPTLYDYPEPQDNPLPPAPPLTVSAGPPTGPWLSGVAVAGPDIFGLTWSLPGLPAGDTLLGFEVWRSPLDEAHFALLAALDATMGTSMVVANLLSADAWFMVRALGTLGGPGPFGNHVHAVSGVQVPA